MIKRERDAEAELNLPPGFRFHPTDEELVVHYLCRKAAHQFLPVPIIADVDLYKFNPWQLPEKALFGQREWYFFTPRDRKYPNGSRPNRAAGSGYWKATGADKPITPAGSVKPAAIKKALVFYAGKAPRGVKTNWIMHEYRLADTIRTPPPANGNGGNNRKGVSLRLDEWVLCRLYNKKSNWEKELQQQRQPQQNPAEDPSFRDDETTEPYEAPEDVASHSQGTPESDVDNDYVFPEPVEEEDDVDPDGDEMDAEGSAEEQVFARIKEEGGTSNHHQVHHHNNGRGSGVSYNDWFLDLNLEDLQNSLDAFGSGGVPGLDLPPYPEQLFSANAVPAPKNGGLPPPF